MSYFLKILCHEKSQRAFICLHESKLKFEKVVLTPELLCFSILIKNWPLLTYFAASGWLAWINQYGDSGRKTIKIAVKVGVIVEIYAVILQEKK